ncbi:hypothetical protein GQ600_9794 [Phytophthora cactorum]|nr:hypothetical protein GQ600_9794 [Phytophthora cactorum]
MVAEHESEHLRGYETDQLQPKQKRIRARLSDDSNIQKLRADIPVLELQRTTLRHGRQQDVWNVVVEYFRIFRFGVLVALPRMNKQGEAQTVSNPGSSLDNAETKQQHLPVALFDGGRPLMDQWRLYSSSFQNLCLQLCRIERSTTDRFVSVDATLNVTVSEATLENVFPLVKESVLTLKAFRTASSGAILCVFRVGRRGMSTVTRGDNDELHDAIDACAGQSAGCASVLEHALITRDGAVGIDDIGSK